jgi:hypothetical protein
MPEPITPSHCTGNFLPNMSRGEGGRGGEYIFQGGRGEGEGGRGGEYIFQGGRGEGEGERGGEYIHFRWGGGWKEGVLPQSKELVRGPPQLVQHFRLKGSSHRRSGAACPKLMRFG